jgi:hypothetical protein
MEHMIDLCARAARKDPVAYRRQLLAKAPRHLGALNLAVEPWPSKKCRHRRMPGSGSLSSLEDLIQFLASDQR